MITCGCVRDIANRYYLTERLAPKSVSEVAVLSSAPARPYRVIADFQARGASASSLQAEAATIGADAVIVSSLGGTYSLAERWAGEDRFSGSGDRIVATAITYK